MNSSYLGTLYNSIYDFCLANNINTELFVVGVDRINFSDVKSFNKLVENELDYLLPKMMLHDQEPVMYQQQKEKWDLFYYKLTKIDRRIIICHSELNSPELDALCLRYDAIPCYFFSNGILAQEWYGKYRYLPDLNKIYIKNKIPRLKYKFSCMNRLTGQQRLYRPILSKMLMDIVDHQDLMLSCNVIDPVDSTHVSARQDIMLPAHHRAILNSLSSMDTPITINVPEWDLADDLTLPNTSFDANRHFFENTFCHIATETLYYGTCLHLTEKSFRPIINRRPFILAGPPNSLEYLRNYGFKTFSGFWDESYDQETDGNKRLDKIRDLIQHINSMSFTEMEATLAKMDDILEYNFNHFYTRFAEKIDDELWINLELAVEQYHRQGTKPGWLLERINQLSETELQQLIRDDQPGLDYHNRYLDIKYDDFQKSLTKQAVESKDWKFIDQNRISYLLAHEFKFKDDSSKDEILAAVMAFTNLT